MDRDYMRHYLRLAVATLMWGGAFVAGRYTVTEVPPFTVAFLRFALAASIATTKCYCLTGKCRQGGEYLDFSNAMISIN